MKMRYVAGAAALALGALWASEAEALACGDRVAVLADLKKRYQEDRAAAGITQSGGLLEVTAAPSGSWTVLLTLPGEPACVVAAGEEWRSFMTGLEAIDDNVVKEPDLGRYLSDTDL